MTQEYTPALYDTPRDQHVSVSLDIGIIPRGIMHGGQYIVTIQAHPFVNRRDAQAVADALKEAIGSRLGLRFDGGTNVS
jgi:hypothetical protein